MLARSVLLEALLLRSFSRSQAVRSTLLLRKPVEPPPPPAPLARLLSPRPLDRAEEAAESSRARARL